MSKVTLKDTPEPQAAPVKIDGTVLTDSKGRQLLLRELNALQKSRITRAVGHEAAINSAYMTAYVFPAVMVARIDEDECIMPTTLREIEAAITRVGDEGLEVLMDFISTLFEAAIDEADALKNS